MHLVNIKASVSKHVGGCSSYYKFHSCSALKPNQDFPKVSAKVSLPAANISAHIQQLNHIQHVFNAIMTSYTEPLKMSDIWAHLTGSQSISVAVNACMHDARFQNDPAVINTVNMSPKKNNVTRYAYVERENQIKSTKALVSMAPCSSRVRVQPLSEDNYSYIHTWINIQRGKAADLDLFYQFVVQISTCGIKLTASGVWCNGAGISNHT